MLVSRSLGAWGSTLLAAVVLAGCASQENRAPVEDRGVRSTSSAAGSSEMKPLPGAENAGKPGYYTIKPGDTLIRIGLETGQSWKDIARWNGIDNPNVIEVGQVVRIVPPTSSTPAPQSDSGRAVSPVVVTPIGNGSASSTPSPAVAPATTGSSAKPVSADGVDFIWPASGTVVANFDEARNSKGIDIAGKAGDPVVAVAEGRVVYAGAGLRGYGNLIILKHNNTYMSAYAHNQTLLVKEDQAVKKGQKIAEMGSTDADRVKLHFEVRRQGKPVDPARYLPAR
jgi:lipoprotein NlpD